MLRPVVPLLVLAALAACQAAGPEPAVGRAESLPDAPVAVAAGGAACWATDRIRAQTETTYVEVPGQSGLQPRERLLRPAEDRLFAVPCPDQIDADLVASLQRALTARGLYAGPVTGSMDAATSEAVRRYQAPLGLDSGILSLDAAQQMGLIAIPRDRI
ncbi:MAG: peptidoglycan-binding protein [Rhodobacteraceae bacterium]|nr:peptidoglycan-binding protein [Paracoccaceae bacterium]